MADKKNIDSNQESKNQKENNGALTKVKNIVLKILLGIKNFIVKTGRVNGTHCYGIIENIGDFLVYDDHALISAVGMDDVTFTKENVVSYSFEGLGRIRRNKATVMYKIVLDDNVIFPEKVREKNDVKNLMALIQISNDRAHFMGNGQAEYDGSRGGSKLENCEVYGYEDCLIIVYKLKRKNGDKIEDYQEAVSYPLTHIVSMQETSNKSFDIKFNDNKKLKFSSVGEVGYKLSQKIKEKI